jgi:phage shock protein A
VQGDAKDPRELVNQMMPEIERRLTETAQQVARRDMTDAPVF